VRIWLWSVAALIFAMVLVGGATRLTESGLSITEWRPVAGTLPPLGEAQWQAEFEKYKTIPQYAAVNKGMSLGEFKTIFWWEWAHRLLGRVIGAAFLLPFLWFLLRRAIPPRFKPQLWAIFALGGLQGAVGWWMVASGLAERISVSQYRLAFHLTLALVIYAAILWVVRSMQPQAVPSGPPRLRTSALALLALAFVQVYAGALVAGIDAGLVYNTWPLIDGSFIPPAEKLFFLSPAWRNVFEHDLTVQFVHRMLAYTLWIAVLIHLLDVLRSTRDSAARRGAAELVFAVTVQAAIGIATLLSVVPISLGLLHQGGAVVVLTAAVFHAQRMQATRHAPSEAGAETQAAHTA